MNPPIRNKIHQNGLWKGINEGVVNVIGSDHAPHTIKEKNEPYLFCPSGGPLVQHAIPSMLEFVLTNKISIEKIVEKMSHNPAIVFQIKDRGFIREGYKADLVLIETNNPWEVNKDNILFRLLITLDAFALTSSAPSGFFF